MKLVNRNYPPLKKKTLELFDRTSYEQIWTILLTVESLTYKYCLLCNGIKYILEWSTGSIYILKILFL